MRRRGFGSIVLGTLATVVAGAVVVAAAFYWRLANGPVELPFLTGMVQSHIAGAVPGVQAEISGVVLERDSETGAPWIRLRDIRLKDTAGNVIAQAPRAAIDFSGRDLMGGRVHIRSLELIGPKVFIRRKVDGSFQMGFGDVAAAPPPAPSAVASADAQPGGSAPAAQGKADAAPAPFHGAAADGPNLIDIIKQRLARDAAPPAPGDPPPLEAVQIREAALSLLDEANQAVWFAPRANLTFRRADYGFVLFTDATVASGSQPWRAEVVTTWRNDAKTFTVNARLFDVVPADIADNVFALSQLAQVNLPLSGKATMVLADDGALLSASADLTAAAGEVGFPTYIADPVRIDGGAVRIVYNPNSGGLVLNESEVIVGGTTAKVSGQIDPQRDEAGVLRALAMQIKAANLNIAPLDRKPGAMALDRLEFSGIAALNERRLDVSDLLLTAGSTAIRTRGSFVGGKDAIGIYLSGRMRDVPASMVKQLWPAVVLPPAREWFDYNVETGVIRDGTFRIEIPAETLAAALKREPIPADMVDIAFTADGVGGAYFAPLPKVRGLSATARITGDRVDIDFANGEVALPSGQSIAIDAVAMRSTETHRLHVPTTFTIAARGPASAFTELLDQEPLKLMSNAGVADLKIAGDVAANVVLDAPLGPPPVQQVKVTAKADMRNAALKGAAPGIDISAGRFAIDVAQTGITVKGPAQLNGQKADVVWERLFAKDGPPNDRVTLEATLDDAARRKLGVDLSAFLEGPTRAKLSADLDAGQLKNIAVDVDLSKVRMYLESIGWSRPPQPKTQAKFGLDLSSPKVFGVRNLEITGANLEIAGNLEVDKNGNVLEATLPKVVLDDWNQVALGVRSTDASVNMVVNGRAFDARRIISNMFAGAAARPVVTERPVVIDVQLEQVLAHRGETVNDLSGRIEIRGSVAQRADLRGVFAGGGPITIAINPTSEVTRDMRVIGRDAGSALRASNLYSKVAGGTIDLSAILDSGARTGIRRGLLVMRDFWVRNEAALSQIEAQSNQSGQNGPRRDGQFFRRLSMPFSADEQYVRIGDAIAQGPQLGATAQGLIGKADGRMDIGGTIIPAYALNAALGDVPVFGDVLLGGRGQGVFGINYTLQGTMRAPAYTVNPMSAIAPGFLRHFFPGGGGQTNPDGTPYTPPGPKPKGGGGSDR